ncbi:uncharacterized protein K441DRAFT_24113 [Cenococcum geophilum 1.58]|uniref:Uncharacterized protein n=1 Tax=Cenococcum geophilum 1.58 TaxID=794803 RepID=A0ACC8EKV3_9PEZI|nr:hypothetical protein K441DRAFT_24113 [Cenococcum geophilum 1.58]
MGRWADGQMGRWADGQMGRWQMGKMGQNSCDMGWLPHFAKHVPTPRIVHLSVEMTQSMQPRLGARCAQPEARIFSSRPPHTSLQERTCRRKSAQARWVPALVHRAVIGGFGGPRKPLEAIRGVVPAAAVEWRSSSAA